MKNKNLFQSSACALRGMLRCFRSERNYRDYTIIGGVCLVLNILLHSSRTEFIVLLLTATATFSSEYMNSALEKIIDTYHNEVSDINGFIKDLGSASVFVWGMAFLICQGVILIPKIVTVLSAWS